MRGIVVTLIGLSLLWWVTSAALAAEPPNWAQTHLTADERAWIDTHPLVRVRVGDVPPHHFYEDEAQGIAVEYLRLISARTGLKFEFIAGIPWKEGLELVRRRERIDLLITAKHTKERESFLAFTRDYMLMPWVIFTRRDSEFVSHADDLRTRRVVVENAYVMHHKLQAQYPEMQLQVVESSLDALRALSVGEADAYVGNLEIGTYLLQTHGLTNIKVAAPTHFGNHNQAMAIRKDWGMLAGIIDKVLDDMTPGDRQAIKEPWLSVRYEYGIHWLDVLRWGSAALLLFGLVLVTISWKNRQLSAEIRRREQVESALREEQARMRLAMNAAGAGTWSWDIGGGELTWDARMQAIFNQPPGGFGGTYEAWQACIHPDDRDAAHVAIQYALKTGEHYEHEYRIQGESGWRTVNVQALTVRDALERPLRMTGMCVDVTERRRNELERERLQRERRQTHKMEALGQLTGGIAHDFNNILSIILGFSGLASERFGGENTGRLGMYLGEIQTAASRAKNLVGQMLAFSRSDTLTDAPLQLHSLIKEDVKMLRASLPTSIEINTRIREDLPPVMMNPVQLNQVLMNLCLNAKDAMQGSGTLTIELGMAEVAEVECIACHRQVQGTWVELSVADSGRGIPPEVLERLFEPFFTTKVVGEGSGMGAAVVHGIVSGHNGHILVDTRPGEGAVFRILFPPLAGEAGAQAPANAAAGEPQRGLGQHVLVVDDEPAVAGYIGDLLELHGYKATTLTDSGQALAILQKKPREFDLLVTDQTMPGLTGVELIKRIRRQPISPPVILCTGFSEVIDAKGAARMGIGYLEKPVMVESLLRAVAERFSLAA